MKNPETRLPRLTEPARLETLKGQIERITFTSDQDNYTVARVKVYGRKDLVTVVGNFVAPNPGEILKMKGMWSHHPKFGDQFKVIYYTTAMPATVYGIRKYLGSGLIKGIGPVIAERIVNQFGTDTLDVIEQRVDDLDQVEGIGKKRIELIKQAWQDQKEIRDVMLFLQTHGVSCGYATKIFRQYGAESIAVIQENPYRLATDILGIGFVTADRIAMKLGFKKHSPFRAKAGILYTLHQLANDGHVFYPYELLLEASGQLLEIDKNILMDALAQATIEKMIVIEDLNTDLTQFRENHKAVYLAKFHFCETRIAKKMNQLAKSDKNIPPINPQRAIEWVQKRLSLILAPKQMLAIRMAIENKILVITGGPGTGKTTLIRAILEIYARKDIKILLAAPTGRAAKRMQEASGYPAKTIHRLLNYSMAQGGFQKNAENPLDCQLLIIDECSMIDTVLMYHLIQAVPFGATVIFTGDVHQLPSVGPGKVLGDIIESGQFPVVELNEIFRQAKTSRIIVNAHRINQGRMPAMTHQPGDDFFFIEREEPEAALKTIIHLVTQRIPDRFGLDPMTDIQVLAPMHKGIAGAKRINRELQDLLNPGTGGIQKGHQVFRTGDKVMQIRNNYEKQVFNGDMGRIQRIHPESRELIISFEDRDVAYDYADLDDVVPAYAISIHKSQGSEFPAVVIPLLTQHYVLLQRNLIYTAITRGKQLVVIVGSKKALAMAINNNKVSVRYTRLQERLAVIS